MTRIHYHLLAIFLLLASQGCISPINMAYDSAAPLAANQISVAAAYNISEESNVELEEFDLTNSYMFRLGYGISDKASLYAGYYHKSGRSEQFFFIDPPDYVFDEYDYYEIGSKFSIAKENNFAVKTLIGAYVNERDIVAYSFYGSFIFTYYHPSSEFELTFITHGTGIQETNGYQIVPGLNIGVGLSSDLKVWALRPEIGINTRSITAGIGIEFRIGGKAAEF